ALLYVLGETGTVNVNDRGITFLAATFFPGWLGWGITTVVLAVFLTSLLSNRFRRVRAKLPADPLPSLSLRFVAAVVVAGGAVGVLSADRGVPLSVVILVALVLGFDYVVRRTRFGRHILALGGNEEASRRAGIRVPSVRIAVFALCSTLAALGGILAASRLLAVNQSSGAGDLLLNAIASAVIGGTSLFGGRGTVWSALTGALVIGSISNGMDLLALASSMKFMITGGVLLAAVTIDAVTRQGRLAAGRA
ncbi:MAG: sugar ABC transporter permease, partial [Chloroflexota bacterium]|nr:sugar ABC transporter permease [Chloroflexota bacterium]